MAGKQKRKPTGLAATKLPALSHAQYMMLRLLQRRGELWAITLQVASGWQGPRFYQLMGRMIAAGWVVAESVPYGPSRRCMTRYAVTMAGCVEIQRSKLFYRSA